jgi:RimJ/RimL family protein N-acetyltransferase
MAASSFDLGDRLPTIAAGRVRLRWLMDDDVSALLTVFGDSEVMRYWSHGPLADVPAARKYLDLIRECFARRELFQWGVELATNGEIIGTCTLAELSTEHRRAELGFALARSHWGRGYMREALPALLDFAFDRLELARITADADPRNDRSIRLLQRLGFQTEGSLRQHYLVNGEWQDAVLFGLLSSERHLIHTRQDDQMT